MGRRQKMLATLSAIQMQRFLSFIVQDMLNEWKKSRLLLKTSLKKGESMCLRYRSLKGIKELPVEKTAKLIEEHYMIVPEVLHEKQCKKSE